MRETFFLKDNRKMLNLLKSIDRFEPFSGEDLNTFLKLGKLLDFEPGEDIIKEGELDCWIYFLLAGEVEISKKGKRIDVLHRSGELFGEMGVLDGSPRSATIRALSKTLVLGVDGSLIDRAQQESELAFSYTVYRLFAEVLADRLRMTTEECSRLKEALAEKEK